MKAEIRSLDAHAEFGNIFMIRLLLANICQNQSIAIGAFLQLFQPHNTFCYKHLFDLNTNETTDN